MLNLFKRVSVKRASAGALILVAGGLIVPHVAFADATQIIVRCALLQACSSTKNTVGAGIQGITAGATGSSAGILGFDASTNRGRNNGVLGETMNGGYGVEGTSGDGAHGGVFGSATTGVGMEGVSNSFYGVLGGSKTSVGVYGISGTSEAVLGQSTTGYGVQGGSQSSYGVAGGSNSGSGVYGESSSGFAVEGTSSTNDAGHFSATSNGTGVNAYSAAGYGLQVNSGGTVGALIASTNASGDGEHVAGTNIALLGQSDNFPLTLQNTAGANLFFVDGNGNVNAKGVYRTFAVTRSGKEATAYSTQTTTPNVEDVGSAELVDGAASVRFDPAFAASIDLQTAYQVFLTPGGDTRGLFIASKTASGFVVRETQGGRGRLSFDYRIVARALGHARERMAFVNPQSDGPKASVVVSRPHPSTHPALQLPLKRAPL